MIDVLKALTTAEGTGTIIPERLDPVLVEEADKLSPIRELIPRIGWSTNAYECNVRTVLPASEFYIETDDYSADNSTYERRAFIIKMLRSEGGVSSLLQSTAGDYINALQAEIDGALKSLIQAEESAILNASTSTAASNFDGLRKQITDEVDAGSASLTLDMLDDALQEIQESGGRPNLIIMSIREQYELSRIMRGNMTYNWEKYETKAGTKLVTYANIPIIPSLFMPTNIASGDATPTNTDSEVLVLDTSQIVIPVVKDITFEEVPATTDGLAFRLKMYEGLACKSPITSRKITAVGAPS